MRKLNASHWLGLYALSVVAITCIHSIALLATLFVTAVAAARWGCGPQAWRLLRRTVFAVLAFNLTVSLGYVLVSYWQGHFQADYLWRTNIRVLLLVFLGFWLVSVIDLLAALQRFPLLRLMATLAISQIKTFERVIRDFRLAFQSRNLNKPRWLDQSRHAAAQAQTLLDKSLASATEAALAMRSRGTFDD